MPEGHTIHRAARDHQAALAGRALAVTSPQGRADFAALSGAAGRVTLRRVEAYGKHLFYVFERGRTVHVHLGLFGKFRRSPSPPPPAPPGSTVRMRLEGPKVTIDLRGPTACALVTRAEKADILARLGPDPLREDADPDAFFAYLARSKVPIGAALMDQSVIAGVGNVYRAEVLHLLRLHPLVAARAVPRAVAEELWTLLVGLLQKGVEDRRIITTRGLTAARGPRIARAESVHVYGRRTCFTCGGQVDRFALRARTVHLCTRCQPYPPPAHALGK
jgi:formamidopyrimidine-DNA glycosylase